MILKRSCLERLGPNAVWLLPPGPSVPRDGASMSHAFARAATTAQDHLAHDQLREHGALALHGAHLRHASGRTFGAGYPAAAPVATYCCPDDTLAVSVLAMSGNGRTGDEPNYGCGRYPGLLRSPCRPVSVHRNAP